MLSRLRNQFGQGGAVFLVTAFTILVSLLASATASRVLGIRLDLYGYCMSMLIPALIAPAFVLIELRFIQKLETAQLELEKAATTDYLTGIYNRRYFIQLAEEALAQAPEGQPITLAIMDADRFKLVNDQFGHLAGDEALCAITRTVQQNIAPGCIFGRFAGDEFILLCPNAPADAFLSNCQHLIEQINGLTLPGITEPLSLSITIGIASTDRSPINLNQLVARADQALLQAKQEGGGRVRVG